MKTRFLGMDWWLAIAKLRLETDEGKYVSLVKMQFAFKLSQQHAHKNDVQMSVGQDPKAPQIISPDQGFSSIGNAELVFTILVSI